MPSTERRPERRATRLSIAATLVGASAAAIACSSSDTLLGETEAPRPDAAPPVPEVEAGADTAAPPPFEGKPLPVTCATERCAVSLVTTVGADPADRAEGYCALLGDKTVACWGANAFGQLGRGASFVHDSSAPARVYGVSDVVELDHTCAVTANGDVFCWGIGPFLQDPESTATLTTAHSPVKLPLPPVAHIGIGRDVGCAALTDGRVLCWGSNENGQLAPKWEDPPAAAQPVARPLPSGAPVRRVVVGTATLVLREDGTVVSWGANPPLGRPSSLFFDATPAPLLATKILDFDLTHDNACMTAGGVAHCWGVPVYPDRSSTLDRAVPEPVYTPEPVVDIATTRTLVEKGITIPYRWCAVGKAGDVYCRGANESGQVGDGSLEHAAVPKKVAGLPSPASRVKVTTSTSCALLTDGTVRCWGANDFGQLGNGQNRGTSPVPVEVTLP